MCLKPSIPKPNAPPPVKAPPTSAADAGTFAAQVMADPATGKQVAKRRGLRGLRIPLTQKKIDTRA